MRKPLVILYLLISSFVYSQETIQDWQKELLDANHDTTRLECCAKLGYLYTYTNIDSALLYLQKGTAISLKWPKHPHNLRFLNSYGSYYATLRDNTKATYYYQQAKDLAFELNNDRYKKVSTFNLITSQYLDVGKYSSGIKALFEFKTLLDATKDTEVVYYLALYDNLSMCYRSINNLEKAKIFATKMLEYSGNKEDTLSYYRRMLEVLSKDTTQIDEAQRIYNKGIKLSKESQNIEVELILLNVMGETCIKNKKFEAAIGYAKLAELLALRNNFKKDVMFARSVFGESYLGLKQYKKAIVYFNQIIPNYKKTETQDGLLKVLKGLAEAYQGLGQYQESLQYHLEAAKLQEEILGKEKQTIAEELNVQYQTAEKEKQIAAKDLAIKVEQAATKSQQQQKNSIIGLLGLMFLVALWALFNYRKKNKLSLALAQEKANVEQQSAELLELNSVKDRLFAIIGHDLRGPVSALHTTLREFSHDNSINIQQKVAALTGNVAGLYDTLNNVLQWAMIQMKGKVPTKTTLSLRDSIDDTLSLLNHGLSAKNISVMKQVPANIAVEFNEQQLQCVLRNILSNAIKFTPQDGFIRIFTKTTDDGKVQLSMQDSGIGIDNNRLQTILTEGKSTQGTADEKGTGLGLKLCADIMKEAGGGIEISSQINKGTAVKITF